MRFGTQPTRVGDLGPNQTAIMILPELVSDRAWAVGAPGACVSLVNGAGATPGG